MLEMRKFQENLAKSTMLNVKTEGFARFSKRRLLATFGGERFAKGSKERLLSLLPPNIKSSDVTVFEQDDNIIVMLNNRVRKGEHWLG